MVCHSNVGGRAASGNACPLLCPASACRAAGAAGAAGADVRSGAAARASSAFG